MDSPPPLPTSPSHDDDEHTPTSDEYGDFTTNSHINHHIDHQLDNNLDNHVNVVPALPKTPIRKPVLRTVEYDENSADEANHTEPICIGRRCSIDVSESPISEIQSKKVECDGLDTTDSPHCAHDVLNSNKEDIPREHTYNASKPIDHSDVGDNGELRDSTLPSNTIASDNVVDTDDINHSTNTIPKLTDDLQATTFEKKDKISIPNLAEERYDISIPTLEEEKDNITIPNIVEEKDTVSISNLPEEKDNIKILNAKEEKANISISDEENSLIIDTDELSTHDNDIYCTDKHDDLVLDKLSHTNDSYDSNDVIVKDDNVDTAAIEEVEFSSFSTFDSIKPDNSNDNEEVTNILDKDESNGEEGDEFSSFSNVDVNKPDTSKDSEDITNTSDKDDITLDKDDITIIKDESNDEEEDEFSSFSNFDVNKPDTSKDSEDITNTSDKDDITLDKDDITIIKDESNDEEGDEFSSFNTFDENKPVIGKEEEVTNTSNKYDVNIVKHVSDVEEEDEFSSFNTFVTDKDNTEVTNISDKEDTTIVKEEPDTTEDDDEFSSFNTFVTDKDSTEVSNSSDKEDATIVKEETDTTEEDEFSSFFAFSDKTASSSTTEAQQDSEWSAFPSSQETSVKKDVEADVDADDDGEWASFSTVSKQNTTENPSNTIADDDTFGDFEDFNEDPIPKESIECFQSEILDNGYPLDSPCGGDLVEIIILEENIKDTTLTSFATWGNIYDVEEAKSLEFTWSASLHCKLLHKSICVDPKNMLPKHNNPGFNNELGLLKPTPYGAPTSHMDLGQGSDDVILDTSDAHPSDIPQKSIPDAEFDWRDSGLTNPLDAYNSTTLDAGDGTGAATVMPSSVDSRKAQEILAALEPAPDGATRPHHHPMDGFIAKMQAQTSSSVPSSSSTTSAAPKMIETIVTATNDSSQKSRSYLSKLRNLAFMKSRTLMFPLKDN